MTDTIDDPGDGPAVAALSEVTSRLERLETLLDEAGDSRWARSMQRLRADLDAAGTPQEQQATLRALLGIYGGMGSFSDVVLQDASGVRPEQRELHQLRSELYGAARASLA